MVTRTKHGRVILSRMIEAIGQHEAGRMKLPRLLEDLQSMYQSLEPSEQPPERDWLDIMIPLERVVTERSGEDKQKIDARIESHLERLKEILAGIRSGRDDQR